VNPDSEKTAEKIKSVKACSDEAQAGSKKEKALKRRMQPTTIPRPTRSSPPRRMHLSVADGLK
jgi:hypothetical protein